MAVKFYLDSRADKRGDYPIRVSISACGVRLVTSLGFSISNAKWVEPKTSSEQARVKRGATNARGVPFNIINSRMDLIRSKFEFYQPSAGTRVTVEALKNELNQLIERETRVSSINQDTFIGVFDEFLSSESLKNHWADNTVAKWSGFRNHIKKYDPDLLLSDMTTKWVDLYLQECSKCMLDSTLNKEKKLLRWFFNWCVKKRRIENNPMGEFKIQKDIVKPHVIYLDIESIKRLFLYEVPANGTHVELHDNEMDRDYVKIVEDSNSLKKTKDLFLFLCSTGLRYSDMAVLKKTDVKIRQSSGTRYLDVLTTKDNDSVEVELNLISELILDKYAGDEIPGGLALPVISNQKMNKYLKELFELAGFNQMTSNVISVGGKNVKTTVMFWRLISTHAGRRSFICNALNEGTPKDIVRKWTGHNDDRAMRPYIDAVDTVKEDRMRRQSEWMNGIIK